MYKRIIRPLLFLLPPETIHRLLVNTIKIAFAIPGIAYLVRKCYSIEHPSLKREVFGLTFNNPVCFAAGFDKNAEVYNKFAAFGFSCIEIGTVTPEPQPGNPKPRSFRLPEDKALINRMGFNNHGVDEAVKKLKSKRKSNLVIGGNIGKNTATPNHLAVNDYAVCFDKIYDYVDYFVVNVSCPNICDLHELQDKEMLRTILDKLMVIRKTKPVRKPVLLKISPDLNFNQVDDTLEIVRETGIDGIVATNTTITRPGLTTSSEKISLIGTGGLSGAPLRDRSTEFIRYISGKTGGKLPIIGVGGIMSEADALEKLDAGASLIQVYTGFIYEGPGFVKRINKAILKRQTSQFAQ
jgi:dihydroorotate dehydrogenase